MAHAQRRNEVPETSAARHGRACSKGEHGEVETGIHEDHFAGCCRVARQQMERMAERRSCGKAEARACEREQERFCENLSHEAKAASAQGETHPNSGSRMVARASRRLATLAQTMRSRSTQSQRP